MLAKILKTVAPAALLVAGLPALAEPTVQFRSEYYTVSGDSLEAIHRDMIWQSPFRRGDLSYVAETGSRFNWKYTTRESRDACAITQLEVDVIITVTLPQHDNPARLEPAVLDRWQQYLEALQQHEQSHVDHALEAVHELEKRLGEIAPQARCREIDDAVDRVGREVLDAMTARDEAFDRATRHGMDTREAFP
jgi:predicted secreted Zn-dependent protease